MQILGPCLARPFGTFRYIRKSVVSFVQSSRLTASSGSWLRTVQGSRGAPTTCVRLAALIMRLTQSVVMNHAMLMCYVDGPLCVLGGTAHECDRTAATIALIWSALGLPLQLSKGQLGQTVTWIEGTLTVDAQGVTATIKDSLGSQTCANNKLI